MAQLPACPNSIEHPDMCSRSDLILLGEDDNVYKFHCRTCFLFWAVSKDRSKAQARAMAKAKRLEELSARERAGIRAKFVPPKRGWVVPV